MTDEVFLWEFRVFGLDCWITVDCDSRIGRWVERHMIAKGEAA